MPFIELDFPREVLEISEGGVNGGRWLVHNWDDLERYWRNKNGRGDAYFTTYGFRQTQPPKHHRAVHNSAIVGHFVMDFDCKDFKRNGMPVDFSFMQEQVRRLHKHLLLNDYQHYVWFSGGGFHIWVPISETHLPTDGVDATRIKRAGRELMTKWYNELDLSCNDPTVAFDLAGMIRIPNSYNYRRGCWSTPLTSDEIMQLDEEDLIELAQIARNGYIVHGSKKLELKLPERKKGMFHQKRKKVSDLPDVSLGNIIVLPCIAQAALGSGNPPHRARYHLASYLADRLRWFLPMDAIDENELAQHSQQIIDICSAQGWADYSEDVTTTQVESIVYKGYPHARCETLIQEGFCVGKCRFHDGTGEELFEQMV